MTGIPRKKSDEFAEVRVYVLAYLKNVDTID